MSLDTALSSCATAELSEYILPSLLLMTVLACKLRNSDNDKFATPRYDLNAWAIGFVSIFAVGAIKKGLTNHNECDRKIDPK